MTQDGRRRLELAGLLALGIAPFYANGLYNAPLAAGHRGWFWAVEVLTWIVMPAALLTYGAKRGLLTGRDLGLGGRVRGRHVPAVVLGLTVLVSFVLFRLDVAVATWAHAAPPAGRPLPAFRYADVIPPPGPQTGGWRLLALVHLCVTAGVVEELYYRAAFDQLFPRGRVAGVGYVIASSAAFAGAHWEGGLPNLAEAATVGVFAAAVFRLTGNLWLLVVGHVIVDGYWLSGGGG